MWDNNGAVFMTALFPYIGAACFIVGSFFLFFQKGTYVTSSHGEARSKEKARMNLFL